MKQVSTASGIRRSQRFRKRVEFLPRQLSQGGKPLNRLLPFCRPLPGSMSSQSKLHVSLEVSPAFYRNPYGRDMLVMLWESRPREKPDFLTSCFAKKGLLPYVTSRAGRRPKLQRSQPHEEAWASTEGLRVPSHCCQRHEPIDKCENRGIWTEKAHLVPHTQVARNRRHEGEKRTSPETRGG